MATYDLIPTMTKYLDPQLAFALLEFVRARGIYKDRDVLEAQIKLLKATNMVEYTMELYEDLHGVNSAPKEMEQRRDAVIQRVNELQENSRRIFDVISDKNTVQNLKADRNLNITFLKVCTDYILFSCIGHGPSVRPSSKTYAEHQNFHLHICTLNTV